jgi:hypothetical protein
MKEVFGNVQISLNQLSARARQILASHAVRLDRWDSRARALLIDLCLMPLEVCSYFRRPDPTGPDLVPSSTSGCRLIFTEEGTQGVQ